MRVSRRVGLALLLTLFGPHAFGQTVAAPTASIDRSFDIQLFHPAVGSRSFITLDSAEVLEHRLWHFGLVGSYARQLYSFTLLDIATSQDKPTVPVRNLATAEIVSAVGLWNRLELGLALPIAIAWGGDRYDEQGRSAAGPQARVTGLGDLRVEAKGELASFGPDRAFLLSISAGLTLPTGDESAFLGEKTVAGRTRALLEYQYSEWLRALLMAGGLFRQRSEFLGSPQGHAFLYGGALELKPAQWIALVGEATGRLASGYYDTNPAELDGGVRFYLPWMMDLLMGAGFGVNKGVGSPLVRAFIGLGFSPDYRDRDHDGILDRDDRCPDEPEDRDGFGDPDGCPDLDNDDDHLPDSLDRCPNDPEDLDRFQDEDGCPDPDNDGDGFPDLRDACPNDKEDGKGKRPTDGCPSSAEDTDGDGIPDPTDKCIDEPEDKDGFEDADGCPDYDNDGDAVPDGYDACPLEPEDFDGFDDNDGCPDPDNDHDGIPDAKDKCPNQPEAFNIFKDDDGCPDGPALVSLGETDANIVMAEHINFFPGAGGKAQLTTNSLVLLGLVARAINGHPEVTKVRIDVHAKDATNADTEERGQAIRQVLIKNGVDGDRLKVAGLGPGRNRVQLVVESRLKPKQNLVPLPGGESAGGAAGSTPEDAGAEAR